MHKHLTQYSGLLMILCLLLTISSCGVTKQTRQLASHKRMLMSAASNPNMSTEEKLDVLGRSSVLMMKEALAILNPQKGLEYVEKYSDENSQAYEKILAQATLWQSQQNAIQRIAFGLSLTQKDYTHDLIDLYPKFKRKYKQVKFLYKLGKFFGAV